jgi:transcriptional regulator with XRE-family HTH domain
MGNYLLQELRQKKGWTLTEAAENIGMSKSYLWDLESGVLKSPGLAKVLKIKKAYRVSLDRLIKSFVETETPLDSKSEEA